MSEQGSKTAIGAFVTGALALAVLGALVFGSGKFFEKTTKYIMYFDSSVKGLDEGASVAFRGVKVGSVESVILQVNPKDMSTRIPVIVELEKGRVEFEGRVYEENPGDGMRKLIDRGMRAQLKLESLVTGKLMVELDYHPDSEVRLVGEDKKYMEIPTVPSELAQFAKNLMDLPIASLFDKLQETVDALNKLLESPQIPAALASLKIGADDTKNLVDEIKKQITPFVENLNSAVEEYSRLAKDTNARMGPLISGVEQTVGDYGKLARKVDSQVDSLAENADEALKAATSALKRAERTIEEVGDGFSKDSAVMTELRKTLRELNSASRSIRDWADYLERHPEALIRGKGGYRR